MRMQVPIRHHKHQAKHRELPPLPRPSTFQSFWMGGFESACQINTCGERIDMVAATQHDVLAYEDYALGASMGIRTVRDGLAWPCIETSPGWFDWSRFVHMIRAAEAADVEVIWNLLHYGWPADVDVLSGGFVERFARFCRCAAKVLASETSRVPTFVQVNEISFLAWAIGYKCIIQPTKPGRAHEVKRQLVRAAIAGMEAVWDVDPRARFMHAEPIIHVVTPRDRPEMIQQAASQRAAQFDAWDMLCGRIEPELGGDAKYLDLVGVNYYHSNQFETPDVRLRWEDEPRDDRFVPLHQLLEEVFERYGRPLVMAETSHFGVGRGKWIREIGCEVLAARKRQVPIEGVCLYPLIDRPDWENMDQWHNSGLWDLSRGDDGKLHRVVCAEYAEALRASQRQLAEISCT